MKTRSFRLPKDTDPEKIDQLMKKMTDTISGGVTSPENIVKILNEVLGVSEDQAKEIMADMLDHNADNVVEISDGGKGVTSRRNGQEIHLRLSQLLLYSAQYPFDKNLSCRMPIEIGGGDTFQKAEFVNTMKETSAGYAASWKIEPSSFVFDGIAPEIAVRQPTGEVLIAYPNTATGKVYMDFAEEMAVEVADEEGAPLPLVSVCHPTIMEVQ